MTFSALTVVLMSCESENFRNSINTTTKFELELKDRRVIDMRKEPYKRSYINLQLRRNRTETKKAPQFIRHNIVSPALTAHFTRCIQNNQDISFDVSAFLDFDENTAVVTISVPYALQHSKTLTHFFTAEETEDE